MNIQILGVKKSSETRKAERYFKERGVTPHFRDLSEKGLSAGELANISRVLAPEDLIDTEGKQFTKRGMQYMEYDAAEEILENPLLMKMPIVRNGSDVTVGHAPETWQKWIDEA